MNGLDGLKDRIKGSKNFLRTFFILCEEFLDKCFWSVANGIKYTKYEIFVNFAK